MREPILKVREWHDYWCVQDVTGSRNFADANGELVKRPIGGTPHLFRTKRDAEIARDLCLAKLTAEPTENPDMANTHVSDLLTTNKITPDLTQWLLDMWAELKPSEGSYERIVQAQARVLANYLKEYKEHRETGDPMRNRTHIQLRNEVRNWLTTTIEVINLGAPQPMPASEEQMAAWFAKIAEDGNWSKECAGCGNYRRSTTVVARRCYCTSCKERYTHTCPKCKVIKLKDNLKSTRDNRVRTNKYYCECEKVEASIQCHRCNSNFIGPNVDGEYASAEQQDKHGVKLCYACANTFRELDCGHHSFNGAKRIRERESLEDDAPAKPSHDKHVCEACFEKADTTPEYWAAEIGQINGKTFDDIRSRRTFGVELEVCQVREAKQVQIPKVMRRHWHAKHDASLPQGGVEYASAILQGDEGLKIVEQMCNYAAEKRWAVDQAAGLHLHVGLKDDSEMAVASVCVGYHLTRAVWMCFVSPSRTQSKYCVNHKSSPEDLQKKAPDEIISLLTDSEERRRWVNWHAYKTHKTVEIRLHQGTLNYDKIANWVKAHTRFVDWCVEVGKPGLVWKALMPHRTSTRKMFLFMTQNIWKDRDLGHWFRLRSHKFPHSTLPMTRYLVAEAKKVLEKEDAETRASKYLLALSREIERTFGRGKEHLARLAGIELAAKKKITGKSHTRTGQEPMPPGPGARPQQLEIRQLPDGQREVRFIEVPADPFVIPRQAIMPPTINWEVDYEPDPDPNE
jgi:hypothetical protein